MKLILGNGKTAKSITDFLTKKSVDFHSIADTRKLKYNNILREIDEVFVSPGIAQNQAIIVAARKKNIPVTSDIELFGRYADKPIIGITGSNGKSSVTALLGLMTPNAGVGGNIGTPALSLLGQGFDYYILELSSYQLDYTQHLNLLTGAVLNITPEHLDRYRDFAHYAASKCRLYDFCQNPIFNLGDKHTPDGRGFDMVLPKNPLDFGLVTCHGVDYLLQGDEVLMNENDLKTIGKHNINNALAALCLGYRIGLKMADMLNTVKAFKGLEHRLEWVCSIQKVDYFNDSKATNAIATITALNALKEKYTNICLIMGGLKKNEDYQALFLSINKYVASVVLIGKDADFLANGISVPTHFASTMSIAVDMAMHSNAQAVLLSPACASFDMFENFEQRGLVFKDCVSRIG
jgi:UDP-N-acetylmuramoylalanine--D-glutamate ligase